MTEDNVPSIAKRISQLFSTLKGKDSIQNTAKIINDILLYGDKISLQLLRPSWDYFAKRKGVST